MKTVKFGIRDINGDIKTYFNWSANALMPINSHAADGFLIENKATIVSVAQKLLRMVNFTPSEIFRGLVLKNEVREIKPHKNFQYLSFTTDLKVAEHFADPVSGFGTQIVDIKSRLGEHGYVVTYTPKIQEVLFHYRFLSILPYDMGFTFAGMNGRDEVESLKLQKEVMILQPDEPFTNLRKVA